MTKANEFDQPSLQADILENCLKEQTHRAKRCISDGLFIKK